MLLLNPLWITDLSFQLSVLATLGILLFAKSGQRVPAVTDRTGIRQEKESVSASGKLAEQETPSGLSVVRTLLAAGYSCIESDLRVTLAAQVFTIPVILFRFQRISLISPLTNILIGWLIAPITALGIVMVIAGLLFLPLAHIVGVFIWLGLEFMIQIITVTSNIPFGSISFYP
jgi:competence protein ComEC